MLILRLLCEAVIATWRALLANGQMRACVAVRVGRDVDF
jgi:hypothetical protein